MTLQEKLNTFENEARGRLRRVLATGNEKLLEIDERLARIASDDWSVPGMRRHLEGLRARAETLRASAIKRAGELPGTAVSRVATGSRAPIQNLAKGLADLAKRIDMPKPKAVETKPEPKPAEPKIAKVS